MQCGSLVQRGYLKEIVVELNVSACTHVSPQLIPVAYFIAVFLITVLDLKCSCQL